ncbi:MAG TPA: MMPL family transporter [Methylomirabilota bacterium]|nr:MMPL family transporter [Methylomirabilota bacterium]
MKRVALWTFDHPVASVVATLLVTLLLGLQIPRLKLDESAEGLMVRNDPSRAVYESAKQRFGSDNLTVVVIKADDVFGPAVLAVVRRLSDELAGLPDVTRVESLTTVKNIKGEDDTLNTEPLVTALPRTPAEVERIRSDALSNRVLVGNLVARDGRAAAITVYADPRADDVGFNHRFVRQVEALIAGVAAPGVTIYQVGAPYTKTTYADYIALDQRTVVPVSIVVLLLTLLLSFRMLQGVVIPVVTAVVSIVWGLGLMALCHLPLTILTGILPSLLLVIGFTEDVHMISEYHHNLEHGHDKLAAIRLMLEESALPILVTTATTIVGFGTLVTTDITMLIQFGWASSLGLAANYVVTMALLPPMLRWWSVPRRFRRSVFEDSSEHGAIPRLMEWLGHFNLRYRVPILVVAGLLTLGSLIGWYRLRVNTDIISLFPVSSPVRVRIEDIHRSLAGGLGFYVVVDTGREDGIKDPAVLRTIAGLQDYLATLGTVDKTVSIADYLRKTNREMHGGDPAWERIPDSSDQVAQYLLMLEGKELTKFVDFQASAANIVVRHNLTGSGDLSTLLGHIDGWIATNVPATLSVRATGEAILFNNASDFMAINELTSFIWTFLAIGIIHALLFTSITAGMLSLIPNVVPILFNYGLMGLLGIPLNTSTALIATIAIGIAVDDTVHHMVTYSRQLKLHKNQRVAMFNTMRAEGRPIIYVSLALAAGFLALVFSSFVATVQFGLLAATVMLLAMVSELTLTPILMNSMRLITLWDLLLTRMDPAIVSAAPLLRGLSAWEARRVVLLGRLDAVPAGHLIVQKGEPGRELYMVVSGRVRVFDRLPDGTDKALVTLGPGRVFGEMALVSEEPRSASVAAETDAEVLRLDFEALERIRRRYPYTGGKVFRNLARVLAGRLREMTVAALEGPEVTR